MRTAWISLLFVLVACTDKGDDDPTDSSDSAAVDADGDGYPESEDCNDAAASVNPGAEETWYDGIDSDCDGADDFDQDGDGVRGAGEGGDCDDENAAVYPGADELCNDRDDDCDGERDEDAVDAVAVYADVDGDGFGSGDAQGVYCDVPTGTSAEGGDCDETDVAVNPGADEVCNGVDDDCTGWVDDDAADATVWYADFDADTYGDLGTQARSCAQPEGYVADATDCDDTDVASFPGAVEVCDLGDNDCDGDTDEGATDYRTYYQDSDSDGYGDALYSTLACGTPSGYSEVSTDCNDADPAISPGAIEACNGVDDDCDAVIDSDAPDATPYYPDDDGDGYGDATAGVASCEPLSGWITQGGDCDDDDDAISPLATEVCAGGDEDCDGLSNETDAADSSTWYVDADSDGYGSDSVTANACTEPAGYADDAEDCDDSRASANPGAREACDTFDNDCDGEIDESSAYDASTWYADTDADGYGDLDVTSIACDLPTGFVANSEDCDDGDDSVLPGAAEVRDLVDQDCDDLVDEDFVAYGDLVVSEIARQPYTGGSGSATNANGQWFEVHNTSAFDIDMSGWYIEEELGDSFYVSPDAGLVVPAGGHATFCYADTWFSATYTCDYEWGSSAVGAPYYDSTYYFDRDDDLVAVYVGGSLIDEVVWSLGADADGDSWPRTARYSMRLDDDSLDADLNDDAGAWCLASSSTINSASSYTGYPDYGTPGVANGSCD